MIVYFALMCESFFCLYILFRVFFFFFFFQAEDGIRDGTVTGVQTCALPILDRVRKPRSEVTVALVGKYIDLPDAYLSVTEALRAGGFANKAKVNVVWVA